MKKGLLIILFCIIMSQLALSQTPQAEPENFLVIELFTSESCSSCPSGEASLHGLLEHDFFKDKNFLGLALHVTYWNDLFAPSNNWVDPYSQQVFDQLQYIYAQQMSLSGVATPQFFLNGEMTPKTNNEFNTFISSAYEKTPAVGMDIVLNNAPDSETLEVAYDIAGADGGTLVIVLFESGIVQYVEKGENAGRTLTHNNLVRVYKHEVISSPSGTVTIDVPEGVVLDNSKIALYLRDTDNFHIIGASNQIPLGQPSAIDEDTPPATMVYPNPAEYTTDIFVGSDYLEGYRLVVTDIMGRTLVSRQIDRGQPIYRLDVSKWAAGQYFITLISGDQREMHKIIKL